jgi:AraC-like DNA-binding protein
MYTPVQDGMPRSATAVRYAELAPPDHLAEFVHCFWELRTLEELAEDFHYHALPDACVNLLFNQQDPRVAGITAIRTTSVTLNLGCAFHYVGVQFYPGVWQGARDEIVDSYVGTPYTGVLPLVHTSECMHGLAFADKAPHLVALVEWCVQTGHVVPNLLTARLLQQLDQIRSVADMAAIAGLSSRQLQRTLKASTGFSPHDLLKVLRVQQSFRRHHLDLYADQSHFINAFRQATGYTPVRYRDRYGV